MTTFAELLTDVYTLTNRPDLASETKLAVRAATLKAHHSDYYYKDLKEIGVSFLSSETLQRLDYKDIEPLYRSLKYLRKCELDGTPAEFLELITTEQTLDSYSVHREDVCYVAGLEIKIRSLDARQYYLMGCYVHPKVLEANYDSWIADEYPLAIIYEAAATVFKTIGFDEQVAVYKKLVADEYAELKLNNIVANGE